MLRKLCLATVVIVLGSTVAHAQVTLELKYPEGSKSVVQSETKTNQTLTLAGMDLETKATAFTTVSTTNGQRGADGSLAIEEKVDVLQTELGLPGGITLQFDSANPDKKADNPLLEPILEVWRASVKNSFTTILDEKNKIAEIKIPDGIAEKVDATFKSQFDAAKRKKSAEQARGFLPDEPVKKGDSWERNSEADFGGGQTMAFRTKYEYDGTIEQDGKTYDKIIAKTLSVSYAVDQTNPMIQVSKSDLKVTESEETILFNRERGAVQQRTSKTRIQGPLTLVINGAELDGKVDLTIEEKSTRQK